MVLVDILAYWEEICALDEMSDEHEVDIVAVAVVVALYKVETPVIVNDIHNFFAGLADFFLLFT